MLPLADDVPGRRAPILTILIIAAWVAMWIVNLLRPDDGNIADSSQALDCRWGLVPEHFVHGTTATTDPCALLNMEHSRWLEVLTAQFLHASWWHIIGNVLFMWVFGASVEARLGRVRFLPFVLACGSLALIVEALATPSGLNPIIGGSGMVAGVLGAYIVLFPSARVWALIIPDFTIVFGIYALGFWMPQMVHAMGYTIKQTSYILIIPYAASLAVLWIIGLSSDRTGKRALHFVISALVAAVGTVEIKVCRYGAPPMRRSRPRRSSSAATVTASAGSPRP